MHSVGGTVLKSALLALAVLWSAVALGEDAPVMTITVNAFEIEGDNPLDAAATEAALAPFIGN